MDKFIKKWFLYFETTASFQAHLEQGFINPDSICFLEETAQLFTNGKFFGICRKRFSALECLVKDHSRMIENILGINGPSVGDGVINNLRDIKDFLTGFNTNETLQEVLEALKKALEESIQAVADELQEKYTELTGKIDDLTTVIWEQVGLLNTKIDANSAEIQRVSVIVDGLSSSLQLHLSEWNEFKGSYEVFKNYVDDSLHQLDNYYHSLQNTITSVHEELEALKNTVSEYDLKITQIINQLSENHILVDELENKFDKLTEEVNNFYLTKGHPDGLAPLGSDGKVPSQYLPSYVDDVVEYPSFDEFPPQGESGKLYVALDENIMYRWSGTQYIEIPKSIGLGETESTAYPGNRGKELEEKLNEFGEKIKDIESGNLTLEWHDAE